MPEPLRAAPYAAMVMDARSGEVLHARNADTRLHPASLTKMMTLYVVFEAVSRGELSMDTKVTISKNAASEPPSKLGLRAGQTIALRYLVRAAAVKSANDAATALGEAVSGSEAAFAERMTRTAHALGMASTTFRNAHGLTQSGHLSTARDMTVMGRQLFYDYPQYYNLFSRTSTDAGLATVNNTNRRFLSAYPGADGIKTGFTNAAGFNLVASAERGGERIIATVFGGQSTAWRNSRMVELLDMGFSRAPTSVALRKPPRPTYDTAAPPATAVAAATPATPGGVMVLARSMRPAQRPVRAAVATEASAGTDASGPAATEAAAGAVPDTSPVAATASAFVAGQNPDGAVATLGGVALDAIASVAAVPGGAPPIRLLAEGSPDGPPAIAPAGASHAAAAPAIADNPSAVTIAPRPVTRPPDEGAEPAPLEVVTRLSTSGGRHWGINVGRFPSRHLAERMLLKTALIEIGTLDEALRKVVDRPGGYDANFVGMTPELADLACRRLAARDVECAAFGPG